MGFKGSSQLGAYQGRDFYSNQLPFRQAYNLAPYPINGPVTDAQIITSLFGNGEQGGIYRFNDLTAMYQNSAGTIPVTALEQPVGLVLDKGPNGIPAFQATGANRPVVSARINRYIQTDDFTSASWSKTFGGLGSAPIVTPGQLDPLLGNTATLVQMALNGGTTTADVSQVIQGSTSVVVGAIYTSSIYVMAQTAGDIGKTVIFRGVDSGATTPSVVLNGNWQIVTFQTTAGSTPVTPWACCLRGGTASSDSVGIYIWRPQLEIGTTPSRYQAVVTANNYDSVGFPVGLVFNGINSGLITPTINLTTYDKIAAFAAVTKYLDTAQRAVFEFDATSSTDPGAICMYAPPAAAATNQFRANGSTTPVSATGAAVSPVSQILTGTSDITGSLTALRINGVQAASVGTSLGSGTWGNYPLSIGARNGGASLVLNGMLYGLIFNSANVPRTVQQLQLGETWLNQLAQYY